MAAAVIRKRCYYIATAARRHTQNTLHSFSTASPSPTPTEQQCPPPKKATKVSSQPKYPRPSTPLSKLGQSRSSRHAEAAAQRASGDPHQEGREQMTKLRKKKKKKRETPVFEALTESRPTHSELPFAFRYSYTEVPKVKPIEFKEKYSPFGPGRLDRPWDGQKAPPIESSSAPVKRKIDGKKRVIDSFRPPTKKGMKPVAPPGPFLPGTGPKKAKTREEILGEPLTKEETDMLVSQSMRSEKQLNIGRDGLTHNLLICFYDYWTRERMVRVKCMGVATVDMDNVVFQIEDKTGGKVIHRAGGTLHVFRGRYYNNKDRPNIPKMLWRPHSPVYPKLVTETPGGLKRQAANALRKRGRELLPLCRLAKNGFYGDLVINVREGFKEDELVRIDCKAVNRPDYKKIGAKLRDLVPCVVLSFQEDQILLWKGKERICKAKKELSAGEAGVLSPGDNCAAEKHHEGTEAVSGTSCGAPDSCNKSDGFSSDEDSSYDNETADEDGSHEAEGGSHVDEDGSHDDETADEDGSHEDEEGSHVDEDGSYDDETTDEDGSHNDDYETASEDGSHNDNDD